MALRKQRREKERSEAAAGDLLALEALDRSGLIVTSEGAFVRAIEVTPPNSLLLSREERGELAEGFGQLVSRLRPGQSLQFYVESRPLDLEELLGRSREIVEGVAGPVANGSAKDSTGLSRWRLYAAMEDSLRRHAAEQAAVRMRALVLCPYVPGQSGAAGLWRSLRPGRRLPSAALERDAREHRRARQESLAHTEMIRSELDALRIPTRLVNGEELAELLWARFNPTQADHAGRGRALSSQVLCDLDTPRALEEARGVATTLREAIARSAIDFKRSPKYVEVDRDVEQAIYAATIADGTYLGALMGAMLIREPFCLSVHVHALDRHSERRRIKGQYRRVFAVNRGAEMKGRVPDMDRYAQETENEQLLAQMAGESRASVFRVAVYHSTRVRGPEADLHALGEAVDHCASEIELATDCRVGRGEFRQEPLWLSTLPLGRDVADLGRRYVTRNAGDLVPLTGTVCGSPGGIPFAFSEPMRTLETLDPWDRSHSNFLGVLAGRSGSGKTMAANVVLSRAIAHGAQAFVLDRAGHYRLLTQLIDGAQQIELGSGDEFAINPWDVEDPANVDLGKISFLLSLHAVMMGDEGLTVLERAQIAAAIRGVYARAALEEIVPRESLLRDELRLRAKEEADGGSAELAAALRNLAERLGEFCDDGVYAYLADRPTTVGIEAPLVVFDTRRCPEEILGAQMFSITEFVQTRIERRVVQAAANPGGGRWAARSIFLCDEAWHLLRRAETGAYANDLARRSRHLGLFLLVSSQQLSDFDTPEGIALVRNSTMQFLLNQHADEVPFIREALNLTEEEAALLTRLATVKGSHSEMFWANGTRGRGKVSLRLGALEYWAFTSEPIRDAPLRVEAIAAHNGDAWAAVHELAANVSPGEAEGSP